MFTGTGTDRTGKTCSVRVFDRRSPIPQLECRLHALRGEGSCLAPFKKTRRTIHRSYEGDKHVPQIGAVVSTVLRSACIEHVSAEQPSRKKSRW